MSNVIKRRAQIGELVVHKTSGRVYRVDDKSRSGYAVESIVDGLPNWFAANEVETVAKREQRRIESVKLSVVCHHCEKRHEATYSHRGSYGEGAIFEVVCPRDWMSDFYTSEVVDGLDELRVQPPKMSDEPVAYAQHTAAVMQRVTGSVSARVVVERRELDGTLTTLADESSPKLIKSRRSCVGCGMRPGALHSNGLCSSCQRGA